MNYLTKKEFEKLLKEAALILKGTYNLYDWKKDGLIRIYGSIKTEGTIIPCGYIDVLFENIYIPYKKNFKTLDVIDGRYITSFGQLDDNLKLFLIEKSKDRQSEKFKVLDRTINLIIDEILVLAKNDFEKNIKDYSKKQNLSSNEFEIIIKAINNISSFNNLLKNEFINLKEKAKKNESILTSIDTSSVSDVFYSIYDIKESSLLTPEHYKKFYRTALFRQINSYI